LKVYYINLDRSTDRRDAMESSFKNEDLIRISGVDGLEWAIDGQVDSNGFCVWDNDYRKDFIKSGLLSQDSLLPPTHVACNISHRNAIEAFLKTKDDWSIILEDDVEPNGVLLKKGGRIEDHLFIPKDADFYYLCGTRPDRRLDVYRDGQVRKVRTLMGYCLSRKAADLFLKSTVPMLWLSDFQFPICCFDSMSRCCGHGITRDRKIRWGERIWDYYSNDTRIETKILSYSIPNRDSFKEIGLSLKDEMKIDKKIKGYSDKRVGLIKHSKFSKDSLLNHIDAYEKMKAESRI
jgi:GR25 family glycosyltransferase involved in LPS biosynthesis